jgi:magnesium transporter
MLSAYPLIPDDAATGKPPAWLDLIDPTEEETAQAAALFGAPIPTIQELSEIETSSRLRARGERLFLSTPILRGSDTPQPELSPLGFLLSPTLLVTVRFAPSKAFDTVITECGKVERLTAEEAFIRLLEEIVDRQADHLERIGAELEHISRKIFSRASSRKGAGPLNNTALRLILAGLGNTGDRLSLTRDSLLGIGRITPFVMERGHACICSEEHQQRLSAVRLDIASIDDYLNHLSGKTQFLLDAVLGLINVAQNDIFKVLTIVSVVGIPPTLVASMYGMNFKYMPELEWHLGYPYALALIVVSTLVPLVWFKWRGWM